MDIGCGIASMIPIDAISVSRIVHPANRFSVGDDIFAVVKGRDQGHICLTHKELLGTWQQNAERFAVGETVPGIVRSIEDYGIFIELAPNLAGLAELKSGIKVGDCACCVPLEAPYFITKGHIDRWVYSTPDAPKYIVTDFSE